MFPSREVAKIASNATASRGTPCNRTTSATCCARWRWRFGCAAAMASVSDHREFDATLHAPYQGDKADSGARTFTLAFDYPVGAPGQPVAWRVELLAPSGKLVQHWRGALTAEGQAGHGQRSNGAGGACRRRCRTACTACACARVARGEVVEQAWDIAVGKVAAAALPPFGAMATGPASTAARGAARPSAAPAAASLPFTVYLANLHSQTNHSDGGGDLATCKGAQAPQCGAHGPARSIRIRARARPRRPDGVGAQPHVRRLRRHQPRRQPGRGQGAVPARASRRPPASAPPIPASSRCTAWSGASSTTAAT